MAEEGHRVTLNVYDLSQGLAKQMSMAFIGKAIEGIWHTGVSVYGNEYYFGGGIQHAPAGSTPYGTPLRVNLEATLRSGAAPQAPQFRPPSVVQPTANVTKPNSSNVMADGSKSRMQLTKPEENKKSASAVKPSNGIADPLGDARSKVQEEIAAEFAALMASGTLRASEAAALATRKVMESTVM
ncbi:hypothetical protein ACLB2K_010930 [Fragaria x ananassa]